jgi:hypothetical protein
MVNGEWSMVNGQSAIRLRQGCGEQVGNGFRTVQDRKIASKFIHHWSFTHLTFVNDTRY